VKIIRISDGMTTGEPGGLARTGNVIGRQNIDPSTIDAGGDEDRSRDGQRTLIDAGRGKAGLRG